MNELLELILHTDEAITAIVARNVIEAYLVLFLIIFSETGFIFFPFLPGDGLLFSAGVIAASTEMSIIILVPILIIAAITGNLTNYVVGRFFGKNLERSQNRWVQNNLIKYLVRTRHFYEKHGEKSIIIGRFFPVIRTYIPFFAGLSGFEFKNFSLFTTAGAILWVPLFSLTGFFLGEIPWVKENYLIIFGGLIIVTLIPFVYNVFKFAWSKMLG
jgi:membrane-associated protein